MSKPPESPIFIVGSGRSGTTLLRSLLSAHPRIAITPESHFMKRVIRTAGSEAAPPDFDAFWRAYARWSRFLDLGVSPEVCLRLIEEMDDRTYRGIFNSILIAYGRRVGKERVGEKTPGHWRYIPRLLEWYPDARIVFMQRDPRAVVASRLRVPWVRLVPRPSLRRGLLAETRPYHVLFKAYRWKEAYERVLPRWIGDGRVMLLRYESLVSDVESEMRRVCEFVGETYTPDMIHDRSRDTPPGSTGSPSGGSEVERHHRRSRGPISTESVERWKDELSPREVTMVEALCRGGMQGAGYRLESASEAPAVALGVRLGCLGMLHAGMLEMNLRQRQIG